MKTKKIVIVGDSAFAEIAHEYFDADTEYEVVAFAVELAYLKRQQLNGLPIVAFETLVETYPPAEHEVYVATVYTQLNRLRTRLARAAKEHGYKLASYISPRAFVWRNVEIGEHCFIFEDNTTALADMKRLAEQEQQKQIVSSCSFEHGFECGSS